ncbi:Hypothetical predicted protein [Olea europaea subsp. europaea]|uniref:Uncharacterized protein n=1 Tax=Olea europaea subsp. europaea TaxID=158383 RepID=A0A8S0TLB0_OLEEU|nr:Hypothetical predicted protein [Olea europaea subsp. europaea]
MAGFWRHISLGLYFSLCGQLGLAHIRASVACLSHLFLAFCLEMTLMFVATVASSLGSLAASLGLLLDLLLHGELLEQLAMAPGLLGFFARTFLHRGVLLSAWVQFRPLSNS